MDSERIRSSSRQSYRESSSRHHRSSHSHSRAHRHSSSTSRRDYSERRPHPVYEYDDGSKNRNEGNTLHIGNIDTRTTKDDLRDLFVEFGSIKSIEIPKDKDGYSRGFAFIAYESADEASRVLNERVVCRGRTLSIQLSKRNTGYKPTPGVFLGKHSYSDHYRSQDYPRRSRSHSRSRRSPSRSRSYDRHGSRSHGYHSRSRTRSHTHHSHSHAHRSHAHSHRSPSDYRYRRESSERRIYSSTDGRKYDYEIRKHSSVCCRKQFT